MFTGRGGQLTVTRDDIQAIARLAHLSLQPEELEGLTRDLNRILEFVAQLEALDLEGVEPTAYAVVEETPLRADRVERWGDVARLLELAPAVQEGLIAVPPVIEEAT